MFTGPPISTPAANPEFNERRHLYVRRLEDNELAQVPIQSTTLGQLIEQARGQTDLSLLELLRNPFNLRIAASLLSAGFTIQQLTPLRSQIELLDRYWTYRVIAKDRDHLGAARERACRQLCELMVHERTLQANVNNLAANAFCRGADPDHEQIIVSPTSEISSSALPNSFVS